VSISIHTYRSSFGSDAGRGFGGQGDVHDFTAPKNFELRR
jgi:hypothetical protein